MRTVYLRADANAEIGWGHVSRMVALGEMLETQFKVSLISKSKIATTLECIVIESDAAFIMLLDSNSIVVLDGYHFDHDLQKAIRDQEAKLVCVDDHQHQKYLADLVINHAPGVTADQISALPHTKYCLGPEYAMINRLFLRSQPSEISRIPNSVLVCFGGSDVHDLSYLMVSELLKLEAVQSIDVILGNDYQGKCHELKSSRMKILSGLKPVQMRDEMRKNEIAIISSSTILFECLSQGLKCISGFYTSNQRLIYQGFLNRKMIVGLGDLRNSTANEIHDAISLSMSDSNSVDNEGIFDEKIQERLISEFQAL